MSANIFFMMHILVRKLAKLVKEDCFHWAHYIGP